MTEVSYKSDHYHFINKTSCLWSYFEKNEHFVNIVNKTSQIKWLIFANFLSVFYAIKFLTTEFAQIFYLLNIFLVSVLKEKQGLGN